MRCPILVMVFSCVGLQPYAQAQTPRPPAPGAKSFTRVEVLGEKPEFEKFPKVALVVGVGGYPQGSGLSKLQYAAKDAAAVADVLRKQGYLVRVLTDAEALRGTIRRSLAELAGAVEPDRGTFLFYFSGHGFAAGNVNYIATYGTTVDDVKSEGLSIPDIETFLKQSGAKRQLMLIDACRNEPTIGGKTVATPGYVADRRQRLESSAGLRVLYSTRAGAVSYESRDLAQGVFTYYLVKGLVGEASGYSIGSANSDGLVTFQDLSQFVIDKMRAYGVERGQVQIPYEAGESSGDFLLTSKQVSPPALADTPAQGPVQAQNPKPSGPCANGCSVRIGDLAQVQKYQYSNPLSAMMRTEEKVYRFPDTWPVGPFLHVASMTIDYSSMKTDKRGNAITPQQIAQMQSAGNAYPPQLFVAATDRREDRDDMIVVSGANGRGMLRGKDGQTYDAKLYGTGSIETFTIELKPTTGSPLLNLLGR